MFNLRNPTKKKQQNTQIKKLLHNEKKQHKMNKRKQSNKNASVTTTKTNKTKNKTKKTKKQSSNQKKTSKTKKYAKEFTYGVQVGVRALNFNLQMAKAREVPY